jgi:ABC-type siderophore export system fused ATPase/permease subunit
MTVFNVFKSKSIFFYFFMVLLSIVGSLTNIGILITINMTLGGKSVPLLGSHSFLLFIGLLIFSFVATSRFQNNMIRLSNDMMHDLELKLIRKVCNASFESFEKLGAEKLYAAMWDTRVLSRIPEVFIAFINAAVTIVCSLIYFFWISPTGCVAVVIVMVFLLLAYLYQNRKVEKDLNKLRDLHDVYYHFIAELVTGFKQIRISFLRNNNLFNKYILKNKLKAKELSVKTSKSYARTELMGAYSWYLVLGFVIFFLPSVFKMGVGELTAFITTVLFMRSPISQLIMVFPYYTALKIAIDRINKIDAQLETDAVPDELPNTAKQECFSIRFENLCCRYEDDHNSTFELYLPDFQVFKQEIVFIVGGNGSGKTTFINLLTGLCKPVEGKIYINEKEVSWTEFQLFSNNMAVVFSNHHLFNGNYDEHKLTKDNDILQGFRKLLNLDGVLNIDYENGRIDTRLSKGQQKRLALLLALLEDKPIIVLDEWAAEQDPVNRRYFYMEWLEYIRSMGKTVVAVSHDDEFYNVADRVVKFNHGRIVSETKLVQEEL